MSDTYLDIAAKLAYEPVKNKIPNTSFYIMKSLLSKSKTVNDDTIKLVNNPSNVQMSLMVSVPTKYLDDK